jgi:hypothetical protein
MAVAGATDVTKPVEGYFRFKLRSGGVYGGVRIFYGPPLDPVTGEELDRSWRWQALFNDEPIDFDTVWPGCTGQPLSEAEYRTYCARQRWAREHAGQSAYADPKRRLDLLNTQNPLPF